MTSQRGKYPLLLSRLQRFARTRTEGTKGSVVPGGGLRAGNLALVRHHVVGGRSCQRAQMQAPRDQSGGCLDVERLGWRVVQVVCKVQARIGKPAEGTAY